MFGEKQVTIWPKSTLAGEWIEGTEAGFLHRGWVPMWRLGSHVKGSEAGFPRAGH